MANMFDYFENVLDNDGLVSKVNYNFQESPSTQAYHQVAAQDNPDYAQAIGDIYRWGDVNRANWNLGLDFIHNRDNKDYLDKIKKEQRAYAEKQQAKAWARADAQRKQDRLDKLNDQKYELAIRLMDRVQQTPRDIASMTPYRTNNTNIDVDLDALRNERQDLINTGNNLFSPENLTGNSINEILYNALMNERKYQQDVKDYESKARNIRSNYQEDLLRNAANNSYLTGMNNIAPWNNNRASNLLSKNDDRSYAAKLVSDNPFVGLTHQSKEAKLENLQDFMYEYNALDTGGWNSDEYNQTINNELRQAGYDTTTLAPLVSYDENGNSTDYVFDSKTGTIYEIGEDDQTGSIALIPIKNVDNLHKFSLNRLFTNIGNDVGALNRVINAERPENFGE